MNDGFFVWSHLKWPTKVSNTSVISNKLFFFFVYFLSFRFAYSPYIMKDSVYMPMRRGLILGTWNEFSKVHFSSSFNVGHKRFSSVYVFVMAFPMTLDDFLHWVFHPLRLEWCFHMDHFVFVSFILHATILSQWKTYR